MLARREGRTFDCLIATKFSEEATCCGGIIFGDVNVGNNELHPELKEDAELFSIFGSRRIF
jgi:hypothetical protein